MRRDHGDARVQVDGKFLRLRGERFLVKGVTYGTFAPDADGDCLPRVDRAAADFRRMAELGVNTVRVYTPPRRELLDAAAREGLRVMIGLPWSQHVAFLDDRRLARPIRRDVVAHVRALADHPAALMFALGNEIPASVVRWHGRRRVERFLHDLYREAKDAAPEALLTYANFPPTEFLDLPFFDVCSFNVYLHREPELRAYLARLQNLAGARPLLLAEAGADSIREGEEGQAELTSTHVRAAFEEGACGAVAFAWTDEWWRGGGSVEDWAFGLVDRERRPKPAAAAVAAAFADAPFPAAAREGWPRVSVVVCAYNAAPTLEDCLSSIERLRYPDYEILLINDGSRDDTGDIGRRHERVRVIDIPNGGLGAARNVGLGEATGDVVAYTDADVRVDPDWLTFLVQPLLGGEDVVGSGGPNVVPADDPPLAQCVARAPGGPTHVLLDDRVAEHVPGCNMAFRREALLAIDGFDPTYLRAGDDVDVCWRLQARGWKIGFAPAALVWHHHRPSVAAYWRQQVGYGEGETWLMAHHPEKFIDGQMHWGGHIYSPLPFVRSLGGTRVNAGVWGTAAFPSVYRTDGHPLTALPHSVRWQLLSLLLLLVGVAVVFAGGEGWVAALLGGAGVVGLGATLGRNLMHAARSDVEDLPGHPFRYRLTIAYLHLVQPMARAWGRVRGMLAPPEVVRARAPVPAQKGFRLSLGDVGRAARLLSGGALEDRFWSESWTSAERLLPPLADHLRRAPGVRGVVVDEGWWQDRDLSVLIGRWGWLDLRALVEEHDAGRCLLRVGAHLRPTAFGVAAAIGLGMALSVAASAGVAYRWPLATIGAAALTLAVALFAASRTALSAGAARRAAREVADAAEMVPMPRGPLLPPLPVPSLPRVYGLRTAAVWAVMVLSLGVGTLVFSEGAISEVVGVPSRAPTAYRPALSAWVDYPGGIAVAPDGDIYFSDSYNAVVRRIDAESLDITPFAGSEALGAGFAGDGGPASAARLDEPAGVAIAPDGDLMIADRQNHRVRRVDRVTGVVTTVAGSGRPTFDGDGKPALETALDQPSAVAVSPEGDLYIADAMNNRVRVVDHATGRVRTVAGDGHVAPEGRDVGDGGPATEAHLFMPSDIALAPDGALYIADMHHNRVRRVDPVTGVITTVAGSGVFGNGPDGVPALEAKLAGPAGIALVPGPGGALTLYVADSYNGTVRRVGPDGVLRRVGGGGRVTFASPSRLAFAPGRGWLYVSDPSQGKLVALAVPPSTSATALVTPSGPAASDR